MAGAVAALAYLAGCAGLPAPPAPRDGRQTLALVNGRWFDGEAFAPRVMYAVGGVLTRQPPARIDETIDLARGFVVPPFGEAHNHNVEGAWDVDARVRRYLRDGVFYVKITNSIREFTAQIADRLNTPRSIDVVFANAGLTATGGHPIALYEEVLSRHRYAPAVGSRPPGWFADRAYVVIDGESDLAAKWPLIRAGRPDFLKVYLAHSGEPAPPRRGLDPGLVPAIVARARAEGWRITAHVETAADFHHAVIAGIDEIAHLPPFELEDAHHGHVPPLSEAQARLADADVRAAARQGTVVVTTTALNRSPRVRAFQVENLGLLLRHGVAIAVGSDHSETSLDEALNLHDLRVFDNATLLRLWCEVTARTIFPARRIGRLEEGYEASFLVLGGDPVADFKHVRNIRLRIKQGVRLPER